MIQADQPYPTATTLGDTQVSWGNNLNSCCERMQAQSIDVSNPGLTAQEPTGLAQARLDATSPEQYSTIFGRQPPSGGRFCDSSQTVWEKLRTRKQPRAMEQIRTREQQWTRKQPPMSGVQQRRSCPHPPKSNRSCQGQSIGCHPSRLERAHHVHWWLYQTTSQAMHPTRPRCTRQTQRGRGPTLC